MDSEMLIQVRAASGEAASDGAIGRKRELAAELTHTHQPGRQGPICIVDDDNWVCDSLSVLLETYGFEVLTYPSGTAFLEDRGRATAACLIVDQHMPGLDGLDLVAELRRQAVVLPTILITGRLDGGIAQRAGELGVLAILEKPFPVSRLVELVHRALEPQIPRRHG